MIGQSLSNTNETCYSVQVAKICNLNKTWMRCVKTWWTIIKYGWTCIGNLQPYIGLLLYPCIPLTTKHMQSIGWEPVASTNHTEKYLVGFGCHLRRRQWRIEGLDGLIPALKFGWEDEDYARWHSTPTLMIAREGGAFTYRRSTSTLIIVREGGAFTHRRATCAFPLV